MSVMRCVLPDQFVVGVFVVDIREFKQIAVVEIASKQALIKR